MVHCGGAENAERIHREKIVNRGYCGWGGFKKQCLYTKMGRGAIHHARATYHHEGTEKSRGNFNRG